MATFQGFTFNMQTGTVISSKNDRPELHMDLDEIARSKARVNHQKKVDRNPKEKQQKKKSVESKQEKTNKTVKKENRKKQYNINVPEAALRELLSEIGVKTEGFSIKLVAEKK